LSLHLRRRMDVPFPECSVLIIAAHAQNHPPLALEVMVFYYLSLCSVLVRCPEHTDAPFLSHAKAPPPCLSACLICCLCDCAAHLLLRGTKQDVGLPRKCIVPELSAGIGMMNQ
jgi:hypothetical protein